MAEEMSARSASSFVSKLQALETGERHLHVRCRL